MNGNLIVADTFEVRHDLRDGRLTLFLDTDLGDNTEVFVSIARIFRIRGDSADFIIEYFNEAGPVGMWRSGKTIDLTSTDFWAELEKLQRAMTLQGEPFVTAYVSDELKIDFNVYPSQQAPFDRGNANLTGKSVSISRGNHVIERDLIVRYPVGEAQAGKPVM
jgi:hypothetical protein